jgi:hypothetical protein
METPGNDEPSPTAEPGGPSTPPVDPTPAAAVPPTPPPPTPPAPPTDGAPDEPRDLGESVHAAVEDVEAIFEGGLDGEWPAKAADAIVNVVGLVRDNTTGRITTIARGLVFGLFVAVIGTAVFVMLIIAAIRLLDEALPSSVWLAYLVLGTVIVIAGALVFRKRNQPAPADGNTNRA